MIESVADRVARLQVRADTEAIPVPTSHASASALATAGMIQVLDDVLDDPMAYLEAVRALPIRSVTVGAATFHGISDVPDLRLPRLIQARYPQSQPGLTFVRRSPEGQEEPNFIHTDRDMGDWTAILYLNPDPPAADGTTFWRHRATGAQASTATGSEETLQEWLSWRDRAQWEPWRTVSAKFNRLLLFHAPLFHSRAIPENYGEPESARMIQLVFGTGSLQG